MAKQKMEDMMEQRTQCLQIEVGYIVGINLNRLVTTGSQLTDINQDFLYKTISYMVPGAGIEPARCFHRGIFLPTIAFATVIQHMMHMTFVVWTFSSPYHSVNTTT